MTAPTFSYRYVVLGLLLSFSATGLVLYFTFDDNTFDAVRAFNPLSALLCLLCVMVAWSAACTRLYLWTHSLGHKVGLLNCARVAMSAEFAIGATPAGVGGPVARVVLLQRRGVPISHGMAVQAADVVMDIAFFILLAPFIVGALLTFGGQFTTHERSWPEFLGILGAILAAVGLVVYLARLDAVGGRSWRFFIRLPGIRRLGLHDKMVAVRRTLHRMWIEFGAGVGVLVRMPWYAVAGAFGCTLLMWVGRYSVLPVILYGFGVQVNILLLFFIQGFLFMAGLALVIPGGGGSVEVLFILLLSHLVPAGSIGVIQLLWRFFTYHLYVAVGALFFVFTVSDPRFLMQKLPGDIDNGEEDTPEA